MKNITHLALAWLFAGLLAYWFYVQPYNEVNIIKSESSK